MPKPTNVPRWATPSGDITEPSSGKKDVGWLAGERPPAQYFNWLLELTYEWLKWIDDGALEAISLDLSDYLLALGSVTGDSIHWTTAITNTIPVGLSTDDLSGAAPASTHTRGGGEWIIAADTAQIYYPIDFVANDDVITAVNVSFTKNTNNSNTVSADLVYFAGAVETTLATLGSSSANAPGAIDLGASGLTATIVTSRQHYVRINPGGSVTPAADRLQHVAVHYTR